MDIPFNTTPSAFDSNALLSTQQLTALYHLIKHTEAINLPSLIGILANIDIADEQGQTLLHLAAQRGDVDFAKLLMDYNATLMMPDRNTHTPFYIALVCKQFDFAAFLLLYGADIHAPIQDQHTSFWEYQTPLHAAVKAQDIETVQFLIHYYANINARMADGRTPLHLAADNRDFYITKLLLQSGAMTDATDAQGETVLLRNIRALNNSENDIARTESSHIIGLLLAAGVATTQQDKDLLDEILSPNCSTNLKITRNEMYARVRVKKYCNPPETSNADDVVRCFLHAQFKLIAWYQHLTGVHTKIQGALSHIPLQEGHLKRLLQLELQFRLINHLKETLVYYNPNYQLGCDKPIAFADLVDINLLIQQIQSIYADLSEGYSIPKHLTLLSEEQKKEAVLDLFATSNMDEVLSDEKQRLLFFEYFTAYSAEVTNRYFIRKWCDILSLYLEKTLPADLKESWELSYTHIATIAVGLNRFLESSWLNNTLSRTVSDPECEESRLDNSLSCS